MGRAYSDAYRFQSRDPGTAAMLSLIPGLGQLYNGQRRKGVLFLDAAAVNVVVLWCIFFAEPLAAWLQTAGEPLKMQPDPVLLKALESAHLGSPLSMIVLGLAAAFVAYAVRDAYDSAACRLKRRIYPDAVIEMPEATSGSYLLHGAVMASLVVLALFYARAVPPQAQVTEIEFVPEQPAVERPVESKQVSQQNSVAAGVHRPRAPVVPATRAAASRDAAASQAASAPAPSPPLPALRPQAVALDQQAPLPAVPAQNRVLRSPTMALRPAAPSRTMPQPALPTLAQRPASTGGAAPVSPLSPPSPAAPLPVSAAPPAAPAPGPAAPVVAHVVPAAGPAPLPGPVGAAPVPLPPAPAPATMERYGNKGGAAAPAPLAPAGARPGAKDSAPGGAPSPRRLSDRAAGDAAGPLLAARPAAAAGTAWSRGDSGNPPANASPQADDSWDATKVDFGPYMNELQRRIRRAWFPPRDSATKRVVVVFKIRRDGSLSALRLDRPSGAVAADRAALSAVDAAAPFAPLPAGAPDEVDIQFTFDYNVFTGSGTAGGSYRRF